MQSFGINPFALLNPNLLTNPLTCGFAQLAQVEHDESFRLPHHSLHEVERTLSEIDHRDFLQGMGKLLQFNFTRKNIPGGFVLTTVPKGIAKIKVTAEPRRSKGGTKVKVVGTYNNPLIRNIHILVTSVERVVREKLP